MGSSFAKKAKNVLTLLQLQQLTAERSVVVVSSKYFAVVSVGFPIQSVQIQRLDVLPI